MRFDGKVAIVTGASSGIGKAVAQAFLFAGASVIAVGRNKPELESLTHDQGKLWWGQVDLRLPAAAETIVAEARTRYGRLDVLVNAAGVLHLGDTQTTTDEDWQRTIRLNLDVPFQLMRAAIPDLSVSRGAVVNVSSINANRPFPNTVAYSVSKAGLDQLTRVAAVELAGHGIRVNAVNPGVVITDLHLRSGMTQHDYEIFLARSRETHPLGRPGVPEDVADAVLFLAAHSWITGVTLPVDGGRHLTVVR
jgi:NAD(P)-dependent dehydrogenase (short-subunit alcohol dehydrogenase family)